MIPDKEITEIRTLLSESARPVVFFDDDADGLSSFLQFYSLNSEAKGIIYKRPGPLDEFFLNKISDYQPDRVFILDIAEVDQDFVDKLGEVVWIDHHAPADLKGLKYYNPMILSKGKDNRPISYWSHIITKERLWVAMVGCVGDWFMPLDLRDEFIRRYPELLPKDVTKPDQALFDTKLGELAKIFSFVIKGTTKSAMTCTKILTRIQSPYEILEQSSSKGKYIWKKYQKINKLYEDLKSHVKPSKGPMLEFIYYDDRMALSSDLSNEILYRYPKKFILIGREKSGEVKCSLRSGNYPVREILKKALEGVKGHGGGHLYACGANIKKEDYGRFLKNIKKQLTS